MPVIFSGREFLRLTPKKQIRLCERAAEEAVELSVTADARLRLSYADLAKQWLMLAKAIAEETE